MSHYSGPQGEDGDVRSAALGQTVAERFKVRKTSVILVSTGKAPLSKADWPQNQVEIAEMRGIPYREAEGALMWVANITRPGLAYTAHTLAKFGPFQRLGGRGCNSYVPVLGGDGTKIAPTWNIFDQPPG